MWTLGGVKDLEVDTLRLVPLVIVLVLSGCLLAMLVARSSTGAYTRHHVTDRRSLHTHAHEPYAQHYAFSVDP